jgi:hypothetical protein
MRRREAGRGAAPAGLVATRHSGGIGAPSGATRSPCQELADGSVGAIRLRDGRTKAGPDAGTAANEHALPLRCLSACGAPEGACVPQGTSHKDFALFGAPSPLTLRAPKRRGKEPACLL